MTSSFIKPIADLVPDNELIIALDSPLCLAPYAALVDSDSKYLSESLNIRLIPSLISLKLIAECADDYHSRCDALLVGDPWLKELPKRKGRKPLQQLEFAKVEEEMIGEIIKVTPLTRKEGHEGRSFKATQFGCFDTDRGTRIHGNWRNCSHSDPNTSIQDP